MLVPQRLQLVSLAALCLASCKKSDSEQLALTYTTVSTLAGNGNAGFVDGAGTTAEFSAPEGVAADEQGNVYVADAANNCIRKVSSTGVVSTWAGAAATGLVNGPAATARFNGVMDVALDKQGTMYVADGQNYCVRKITAAGLVSTLAGTGKPGFLDGAAATATFGFTNGVAVDGQGTVYVADHSNCCIRKITAAGVVSTLAGTGTAGYADGPGSSAQFEGPEGLALDSQGAVYVADFNGLRIRKITPAGVVSTVAGTGKSGSADGPAATAEFQSPSGVVVDGRGNLYVSDGNSIRKISLDGTVSTVAGTAKRGWTDGPVSKALFDAPCGIALDAAGALIVTEYGQHVRKITP